MILLSFAPFTPAARKATIQIANGRLIFTLILLFTE